MPLHHQTMADFNDNFLEEFLMDHRPDLVDQCWPMAAVEEPAFRSLPLQSKSCSPGRNKEAEILEKFWGHVKKVADLKNRLPISTY